MRKKWIIICTIFMIVGVFAINKPHKPKLISNISTLETAYLTILVDKWETKDIEKLEEKLLQMCREDSFEGMKLNTEDRPMSEQMIISVYTSKSELKKGIPFMTIKKDAKN